MRAKIKWAQLGVITLNDVTLEVRPGEVRQYDRYKRSDASNLFDVYKQPSDAKMVAYADCKALQARCKGTDGRILWHNSHYFSYGFRVTDENLDNWLVVVTAHRRYAVPI